MLSRAHRAETCPTHPQWHCMSNWTLNSVEPTGAVNAKCLCSVALIITCTVPRCWPWKTDLGQGSLRQLLLGFSYTRCHCWSGNKVLRSAFFPALLPWLPSLPTGIYILVLLFSASEYINWMRILISQICLKSYPSIPCPPEFIWVPWVLIWDTWFLYPFFKFVTNSFFCVLCKVSGPKILSL